MRHSGRQDLDDEPEPTQESAHACSIGTPRTAPSRDDGGVRVRQDDRRRGPRPAPARPLRGRRRLPPRGQHRQDVGRHPARRRRPRALARGHRRLAGRARRHRRSRQLLGPQALPTATSSARPLPRRSTSTCTATATCSPPASPADRGTSCPPPSIDSQFATLEVLQPDELGAVLDVAQPVDTLVDESLTILTSLAPKGVTTHDHRRPLPAAAASSARPTPPRSPTSRRPA